MAANRLDVDMMFLEFTGDDVGITFLNLDRESSALSRSPWK